MSRTMPIVLVVVVLVAVLGIMEVSGASHYCPSNYNVRVYRCGYTGYTYRCGYHWHYSWWHRHYHYRWCRRHTCWYSYVTRSNPNTCCKGWKGSGCNIPICSSCPSDGLCVNPNDCRCPAGKISSGGKCKVEQCSFLQNCYPGTCTSDCVCSSGYDGNNCEQILDGPNFVRCSVSLRTTDDRIQQGGCGVPIFQNHTYHTNLNNLEDITVDFETMFSHLLDYPEKPSYISESHPGVVGINFDVKVTDSSGAQIYNQKINCNSKINSDEPYAAAECRNHVYSFNMPMQQNYRVKVIASALNGGFKRMFDPVKSELFDQNYNGTTSSQEVNFIFDMIPPYHCSKATPPSCNITEEPALEVSVDNPRNEDVNVGWFGWTDDDSGLDKHIYEIYLLHPNTENHNLLEEDEIPIFSSIIKENDTFPVFRHKGQGMYSIQLQITDRAGNEMKARTLILRDPDSKISKGDGQLTVDDAPDGGWVEQSIGTAASEKPLIINWNNLFQNEELASSHLLNEVKPWATNYFDDQAGNRTIDAVTHKNGIWEYQVAHALDQTGGQFASPPEEWQPMDNLDEEYSLIMDRRDGDSIKIWVKATDPVMNEKIETALVHIDSSGPTVGSPKLETNVETGDRKLPYASSVVIEASDEHSGLGLFAFVLFDTTDQKIIRTEHQEAQLVSVYDEKCKPGVSTGYCSCIPALLDRCYYVQQKVYIDHCWLKDYMNHAMEVRINVTNNAQLKEHKLQELGTVNTDSFKGTDTHLPPEQLEVTDIAGYHAMVRWESPICCFTVVEFTVQYERYGGVAKEVRVAAGNTSYHMEDLVPGKDYVVHVIAVYDDQVKEERTEEFNSGECRENCGLAIGAIIGIVIAFLLLLLIILLIIFIIIRRRQHRPLIPQKIYSTRDSIWNKLGHNNHNLSNPYNNNLHNTMGMDRNGRGMEKGTIENDAYARPKLETPHYLTKTNNIALVNKGKDFDKEDKTRSMIYGDDDMEIYGSMETDDKYIYPLKDLELGKRIGAGRFADIRQADLAANNEMKTVAAKMVKGVSDDDKKLMKAKINFMADGDLHHEYIVNFVGAVMDESVIGPIMLLEFCNLGRLNTWLQKEVPTVTEEIEDNMINFSTEIAMAMEYLHHDERLVLHRRLGARNVLLHEIKPQYIVAKVTGFGPMRGEEDGASEKEQDKIPIKWMAPEQLEKKPKEPRVYTKETDVWSYGITLWEIFSKGETPYPNKSSGQIKAMLKSGKRLPRPQHCTDLLYKEIIQECWEKDPEKRPSFEEIRKRMDSLFHSKGGDGYYDEQDVAMYDNDNDNEKEMYGNEQEIYDDGGSKDTYTENLHKLQFTA